MIEVAIYWDTDTRTWQAHREDARPLRSVTLKTVKYPEADEDTLEKAAVIALGLKAEYAQDMVDFIIEDPEFLTKWDVRKARNLKDLCDMLNTGLVPDDVIFDVPVFTKNGYYGESRYDPVPYGVISWDDQNQIVYSKSRKLFIIEKR